MKQRHRRKQIQLKTRRSRTFDWGIDRFLHVVIDNNRKLSAAFAKAYAASREEMKNDSTI